MIIEFEQWNIIKRDGREIVKVRCPGCGVRAALDHTVDPDGTVRPSLDCTMCDFHEFVKLNGWSRAELFISVP